jgi:hypothetical protein
MAGTVIDTTVPANPANGRGNAVIGPWGEPNSATFGQTITVPAVDNTLANFTFFVDDYTVGVPEEFDQDVIDYQAFVYAWDVVNNHATGPALYSSGPLATIGADDFETISIDTGALPLASGNVYVVFLSSSNLFDAVNGRGKMSSRSDNPYAGGMTVICNSGDDFGLLVSQPWDVLRPAEDMAFQVTFVPEPSGAATAVILAGWLLAGAASRAKNRRPRDTDAEST